MNVSSYRRLFQLTTQLRRQPMFAFGGFREERDTFGPIQVPADKLWAAQTQRSIQNFDIARDTDRMPLPIVKAFGVLKKSAAKVNVEYALPQKICKFLDNLSRGHCEGVRLSNRRETE